MSNYLSTQKRFSHRFLMVPSDFAGKVRIFLIFECLFTYAMIYRCNVITYSMIFFLIREVFPRGRGILPQ